MQHNGNSRILFVIDFFLFEVSLQRTSIAHLEIVLTTRACDPGVFKACLSVDFIFEGFDMTKEFSACPRCGSSGNFHVLKCINCNVLYCPRCNRGYCPSCDKNRPFIEGQVKS